jgi:hypothetical protein
MKNPVNYIFVANLFLESDAFGVKMHFDNNGERVTLPLDLAA